jgi:hypothetical protein
MAVPKALFKPITAVLPAKYEPWSGVALIGSVAENATLEGVHHDDVR